MRWSQRREESHITSSLYLSGKYTNDVPKNWTSQLMFNIAKLFLANVTISKIHKTLIEIESIQQPAVIL